MEPQYQPDFRDDIVQKMQDEIVGQYEQLKRAHQTIEVAISPTLPFHEF